MKHLGTNNQNESIVTKSDLDALNTALSSDIAAKGFESNLKWGGGVVEKDVSPIDAACLDMMGANRLLGFPAERIKIQHYNGTAWDTETAATKAIAYQICGGTAYTALRLGNTISATTKMRARVTFATSQGKSEASVLYCVTKKLLVLIQDGGMPGLRLKVSGRYVYNIDAGNDTWKELYDCPVSGWPAWFSIPLNITFGNPFNQADLRYGEIRIELYSTATASGTYDAKIMAVRLIAPTIYSPTSGLMYDNKPYGLDNDGNMAIQGKTVFRNSKNQEGCIYLSESGELRAYDPVHGDYALYR